MQRCTPEQAGIASRHIVDFLNKLEEYHLSTHSVLMARGDHIFFECYYKPFHKDFRHRMYSVSKSFVSVAIGFCEQDGLLSLDDPLLKFFPEYATEIDRNATIREMLTMQTTLDFHNTSWFRLVEDDRVACYFTPGREKLPGTLFRYDSSGSFLLGAIVEKLTGKPFMEYLKEKVLLDIGFSKEAYCLQAPGGFSWGDSGVMCTAEELMLFARFVLNMGSFDGKRYLNEEYLRAATATTVCNSDYGFISHEEYGYGYQFWGAPQGCFAMLGMGNQIALCDPKHDFIFVINSDNQGNTHNYEQIYEALYTHVIAHLEEETVCKHVQDVSALQRMTEDRELFYLTGPAQSDFSAQINGKRFVCAPNPMGIQWFTLTFDGDEGVFSYENGQGRKDLRFGLGHNVFQKFPQEGYADLVGTVSVPGHKYDCACSADWPEAQKLRVRVQIIDKYFGNLAIVFGFRDEGQVSVRMTKKAEYFLEEYSGIMNAEVDS